MSGEANDDRRRPPDGLLTSEDLFGDLVDAPIPPRPVPEAALRPGPIRVQVSEPASPEDGGMEPGSRVVPLAREVAALLDALPGGDAGADAPRAEAPVAVAAPERDAVSSPRPPKLEGLPWRDLEQEGLVEALGSGALTAAPGVPTPDGRAPGPEPTAPPEPPPEAPVADVAAAPPPESSRSAREPDPQHVDQLLGVMGSLRTAPRLEARYSPPAVPSGSRGETAGEASLDLGAVAQDAFVSVELPPEEEAPSEPAAAAGAVATPEGGSGVAETEAAAPAPDDEGDTLYGPYRLLERVAIGGMAEVFRAKRSGVEGFEKVLAVKRILPHLSDNQEFVDMFIEEAKMVAGLSHPNIVQIFDLGRIERSYYIAMEYVHGRDLRSILRRGKERGLRVPLDLSVLIVSRICSALDYAHRRKDDRGRTFQIVHRDISPQNILISFDGEVKLTDFGIAKAAPKMTPSDHGALRGKLLYMSPEQAGGRPMDRRSDIFSLGIVFYEMLTDQKPFLGTSEMSILETVRECRVAPPSQLNPRLPEKLERVVMKALAREPEQRYQDGAEMLRDLERVLHERQAPTAVELARFMEILFDRDERGDTPPEEGALADARHEPGEGGLEMEFDALPDEEPPPPPEKEALSLHRILKRFGIR
jgi:serine/threonine protein kinase